MKTCALSLTLVAGLLAQTAKHAPAPPEARSETFGSGIQRTMTLLATSTVAHRNPVRVLFYGQSITKQDWSRAVAEYLRTQFPFADLSVENRAIGGYSTEFLIQTVAHDVYALYPDLIIFHDFGGHENYEKIIAGIRRHTTAEILVQNDFPQWIPIEGQPDTPVLAQREAAREQHSLEWLPDLCARYGCELVDVRRPWVQYLRENHLKAAELLNPDGVHLNEHGNYLLAEITKRHLRYDHSPNAGVALVRTYDIGSFDWKDGRLTLEFEGNRIDAVAAMGAPYHAGQADVRIDGKPPSEIPELYFITRPTDTFAVDWPAVNRVTAAKPLLAEDWVLRVRETNADDSIWRFDIIGSKTGPDGQGSSDRPFVSKSGRVMIDPSEWGVSRAYRLRNRLTPVGFEVRWQVAPMFLDVYRTPRVADPSQEYTSILALGLSNGKHTLELITRDKTNPPIRSIRVFTPPLR